MSSIRTFTCWLIRCINENFYEQTLQAFRKFGGIWKLPACMQRWCKRSCIHRAVCYVLIVYSKNRAPGYDFVALFVVEFQSILPIAFRVTSTAPESSNCCGCRCRYLDHMNSSYISECFSGDIQQNTSTYCLLLFFVLWMLSICCSLLSCVYHCVWWCMYCVF